MLCSARLRVWVAFRGNRLPGDEVLTDPHSTYGTNGPTGSARHVWSLRASFAVAPHVWAVIWTGVRSLHVCLVPGYRNRSWPFLFFLSLFFLEKRKNNKIKNEKKSGMTETWSPGDRRSGWQEPYCTRTVEPIWRRHSSGDAQASPAGAVLPPRGSWSHCRASQSVAHEASL